MGRSISGDEVHGDSYHLSGDFRGATVTVGAGTPAPEPPAQPHVFLSYGWSDDRDFVERLRADLVAAGIRVWRDVEDLPSRGNALRLELREAMDGVNRFVPVVGPAAAASDAVRLEWAYARDRCLPVTPVLRLGDEGLLPPEFRGQPYFDFRERPGAGQAGFDYAAQLAMLVERLREAPTMPGTLHGAFSLPPDRAIARSEVEQLAELLRPGQVARAITGRAAAVALYAPGGVGKSTLAVQFMRDCQTRRAFPDGLFWLSFGRAPQVAALQADVGKALGDNPTAYRDVAGGKARLQALLARRKALLVLDDVWDTAHAEALLVDAPDCRWLITSRFEQLGRRLGLPRDNVLRLDVLSADEGVALIAARLGWPAGSPHPDAALHGAIVVRLGGHTQAVALAAGRLVGEAGMPAAELLRRLERAADDNPFALLALSDRDREQNLELSLAVSYDALDDDGRRRFRALGAFADGGTMDAAALAAVWGDHDPDAAADAARALVGASLLERAEGGRWLADERAAGGRVTASLLERAEGGRWRQHTLLRAYALALLTRAGEVEAARGRHFGYYAGEYGDRERNRPYIRGRHAQIDADFEDIRHALAWEFGGAPAAACDLVEALDNSYIQYRQPYPLRRALLEDALAAAERVDYVAGRAEAVLALGEVDVLEADYPTARGRLEAALALFWSLGAVQGIANALLALGELDNREDEDALAWIRYQLALTLYRLNSERLGQANTLNALGDLAYAADKVSSREYYEQALSLYQAIGDANGEAYTTWALGELDSQEGLLPRARQRYEAALGLFRRYEDKLGEAHALRALGDLDVQEGDLESARARYETAITRYRPIPNRRGEANALKSLGDLDGMAGDYAAARDRYAAALSLFREISDARGEVSTLLVWGQMAQTAGALQEADGHYQTAMALVRSKGWGNEEAIMKVVIARLRVEQGEVIEPMTLLSEAYIYFQEHGMDEESYRFITEIIKELPGVDAAFWTWRTAQRG